MSDSSDPLAETMRALAANPNAREAKPGDPDWPSSDHTLRFIPKIHPKPDAD